MSTTFNMSPERLAETLSAGATQGFRATLRAALLKEATRIVDEAVVALSDSVVAKISSYVDHGEGMKIVLVVDGVKKNLEAMK